MTLAFDPTGTSPNNDFYQELHPNPTTPHVAPINAPFYLSGLVVRGIPAGGVDVEILTLGEHFVMSPIYVEMAANTGKEVYSYILLTDYNAWDMIKITYHATGGDPDAILLAQIVQAGDFDRTNIDNWLSFEGGRAALQIGGAGLSMTNSSTIYMLAAKLDAIANALRTPSAYIDFINNDFADLVSSVESLKLEIASTLASINQNGAVTGDTVSATWVESEIQTAVNALGTASTKDINYFAVKSAETIANKINAITGIIKRNSDGTFSAASAGTDFASGSALTAHLEDANAHPGLVRKLLTGDTTFYFNSSATAYNTVGGNWAPGSDTTGDGTIAHPFKSLQKGYEYISETYDIRGYSIILLLAPSLVSYGTLLVSNGLVGQNSYVQLTIKGAITPTSTSRAYLSNIIGNVDEGANYSNPALYVWVNKGDWDASSLLSLPTASPSNKGWFYNVSVAGNTNINGINEWKKNDALFSDGVRWQKCDNADGNCLHVTTGCVVTVSNVVVSHYVIDPEGVYTTANIGRGITANVGGTVLLDEGIVFDVCTYAHLGTFNGGIIAVQKDYEIIGSSQYHLEVGNNSTVGYPGAGTVTVSVKNGLGFNQFANVAPHGSLIARSGNVVFSITDNGRLTGTPSIESTVTGTRYYCQAFGYINAYDPDKSLFPGSIAGSVHPFGLYE